MNTRFVSRAIPSLLVVALLALAAATPTPQVTGPAPPPQLQPPCTEFASAVSGDSTVQIGGPTGIEQAFPSGMSVAACSLRTAAGYYVGGSVELREWDPTTLAPDPNAVALRRQFFFVSGMLWAGGPKTSFVPPVVTSSVPDVAEPPRPQTAIQLANVFSYSVPFLAYFTPEGPPELPAAVLVHADGSREPLRGPHPVLAHALCTGDSDLASLRIVQSVARTDVKPFPPPKEFLQKFRVPQRAELRWIELALAETNVPYFETAGTGNLGVGPTEFPEIAVYDAADLPNPVSNMPPPLVWAPFDRSQLFSGGKIWISHLDFDKTVTLEPDHDYWIWVRKTSATTFFNRRVHGDEPPAFTAGIGPYFARADTLGEWIQAPDQILAFRIVARPIPPPAPPAPPPIARPASPTGPPVPPASAFALSTTPNPTPGAVRVDWSGAVGPVRCEVLDARGRRVAEGSGGAAGAWTWAGTDRDGRAVASGVYFVRAHDSAGQISNQRVMVVR